MIFTDKVAKLLSNHTKNNEMCDNAYLIDVNELAPPVARHVVYFPMEDRIVKHLIDSYKGTIPKTLLTLYKVMNGGDLFWTKCCSTKSKLMIPVCCLSIHGVPIMSGRMEPFNISVEDLKRPNNAPKNCLKFASYCEPDSPNRRYDLYIDTNREDVYSVERANLNWDPIKTWKTIDLCLCDLFDMLSEKL